MGISSSLNFAQIDLTYWKYLRPSAISTELSPYPIHCGIPSPSSFISFPMLNKTTIMVNGARSPIHWVGLSASLKRLKNLAIRLSAVSVMCYIRHDQRDAVESILHIFHYRTFARFFILNPSRNSTHTVCPRYSLSFPAKNIETGSKCWLLCGLYWPSREPFFSSFIISFPCPI